MASLSIDQLPAVQAALDSLIDPAYVVDREFNLLWVNQAYTNLFGYRPRKRLLCHQVAQMDICGTDACLLRRCSRPGGAGQYQETKVAGAQEKDASCLAAGIPFLHPETQEVVAVLGMLRDNSAEVRMHKKYSVMLAAEINRKEILERMVADRTAELVATNDSLNTSNADLHRSRREVVDILENISQAILTIDEDLVVGREYSKFSERVFARGDLAGQAFPELISPGASSSRERRDLAEWLKLVFHSPTLDWSMAKSMVQSEYKLKRADGRDAELSVDFEPIREDQRIRRVMVLIEDLTEKRELERAIDAKDREMNESLEHLAELARLDPELYEAVFEEALEIIQRSSEALRTIGQASDSVRVIDGMFRDMHTLKGNAMSFGMVRVAAKAHWVEDAFSRLRESAGNLTPELIAETEEKVRELGELFDRIQKMASRVLSQTASKDNGAVRSGGRAMKIEVEPERIDGVVEWARHEMGDDPRARELVTRLRSLLLVPFSRVYARFPRMLDDLADSLDKRMNPVVLEGGDIALEPTVFNKFANALVHLLRNSIDHGIEAPSARLAAGKPAYGDIRVRAYYDGDRLRVDVSDDGRGLDPERLLARAREKGLLGPGEMLDRDQALHLIFRAGFSTAEQVTDTSGRGVGMDAVWSSLEEMGGAVEIVTDAGRGTTFRLSVPIAVACGA